MFYIDPPFIFFIITNTLYFYSRKVCNLI